MTQLPHRFGQRGFEGDVVVALEMGYNICTDVQHGVPQDTTIQAIYENAAESVAVEDAQHIYVAAVIHLCWGAYSSSE